MALFNVGLMYEFGQGVRKSSEDAVGWYTKSAAKGYPNAVAKLRLMPGISKSTDALTPYSMNSSTKDKVILVKAQEIQNPIYQDIITLDNDKPSFILLATFTPQKSCTEYLSELCQQSGIPSNENIFREILKWHNSFTSTSDNPYFLTPDEVLAIGAFTWQNLSETQTLQNWLNITLMERNTEKMKIWEGFLYFLQSAFAKLPPIKNIGFYPIQDFTTVTSSYELGTCYRWQAYHPISTNFEKTRELAGNDGLVLKIHVISGKSVEKYSAYPKSEEEELVLSPNMKFFVAKSLKKKDGITQVELVQQNEGETFIF